MCRESKESETQNPFLPGEALCSTRTWIPKWHQFFLNPYSYFIFFSLVGIVQGAYFTYLIGVLSTLERRYAFDSWITSVILIADNISPILFSVLVGYCSKHIHRPKLLASGMVLNVFCCILACCPFFLFGSVIKQNSPYTSRNTFELCYKGQSIEKCDKELYFESIVAVCILFIANFIKGICSSTYYTIGTAYLDDNIKKNNSPFYLGVCLATRLFGPSLGFMLSGFCLTFYEDPFVEPDFGVDDSRWIGAWWIGFLIIGFFLLFLSVPIFFFPQSFSNGRRTNCEKSSASCSDFVLSLKKLVANRILLFHTLSIVFQINGVFGYFAFVTKYIENQFKNSSSSASFYSGAAILLGTVPSALFGGLFICKFKPRPRILTGYMLFVQISIACAMFTALLMNCGPNSHGQERSFLQYNVEECNALCSCSQIGFDPVCDMYGNTHFSPCSAGCQVNEHINKLVTFKNCSCIVPKPAENDTFSIIEATKGICSENCDRFVPYLIIIFILHILVNKVKVGNMLITLRCVDEVDKTLALGAIEAVISVLATIPYPLLYSFVIDKSCLKWETTCGQKGNCLFYDNNDYRIYFHSLSITFIFLSVICDIVVFVLSTKMTDLYTDKEENSNLNVELNETVNKKDDTNI